MDTPLRTSIGPSQIVKGPAPTPARHQRVRGSEGALFPVVARHVSGNRPAVVQTKMGSRGTGSNRSRSTGGGPAGAAGVTGVAGVGGTGGAA